MKILIIGCGSGLGRVLPAELTAKGHEVILGFHHLEKHRAWVETEAYEAYQMDVTRRQELESAANQIASKHEALDVVISVAGILSDEDRVIRLKDQVIELLRENLEVNAISILSIYQCFEGLVREGGQFLFMTSEAGSFAADGDTFPMYSISKTAANRVVQILRFNNQRHDVFAVHPGRMNTEMGRDTYNIEPEDTARGLADFVEGKYNLDNQSTWFVDYLGGKMDLE